jgi:hypothetical protein
MDDIFKEIFSDITAALPTKKELFIAMMSTLAALGAVLAMQLL